MQIKTKSVANNFRQLDSCSTLNYDIFSWTSDSKVLHQLASLCHYDCKNNCLVFCRTCALSSWVLLSAHSFFGGSTRKYPEVGSKVCFRFIFFSTFCWLQQPGLQRQRIHSLSLLRGRLGLFIGFKCNSNFFAMIAGPYGFDYFNFTCKSRDRIILTACRERFLVGIALRNFSVWFYSE